MVENSKTYEHLHEYKSSIVCLPQGCCVEPPSQALRRETEGVVWCAVNCDAVIWFPTGQPFGWERKDAPRGTPVHSGAPTVLGVFPYAVYCTRPGEGLREEVGDFAKGSSPPKIIVW